MKQTALDPFTHAYIECALWSSIDDNDHPLDKNHTADDLAPEARASIIADCAAFQADHEDDIADDPARAGHDFWLTRNGHGAGFWDGDWPDAVGRRLTKAAEDLGKVDLYVGDDGQVHAT